MLFLRRLYNLIRVLNGYLISCVLKRPVFSGGPVAFSAEPTTSCNLRCPECPTGQNGLTRQGGNIDPDLFRQIADAFSPTAFYLTLYFQGEPYLHPRLFEMIRYAKSKRLVVSTSTNGHFLTEPTARETVLSGLDRLIVSVDGSDQDTYSAYRRGGELKRVLNGLKLLSEVKKELHSGKPEVVIQCLLLRSNLHQKEDIRRIGREAGADRVVFKTAQFNDFDKGNPLMPEGSASRYKAGKDLHYVIKNRLRNRCFRMWSSCVVTWDGLVVPCCFDKDANHLLGDLKHERLPDIWNSEKYMNFRKEIFRNRKSVEICRNCTQKF